MRMLPKSLRLSTALFLIVHGTALNLSPAFAGLAPSRLSGETSIASTRDADLVLVRRALEHRLVAQKLRDYGVARAQVESRLAELSDRDLHDLASVSKGLPSGSDGLGSLVTVLVIILLVIVILKLLNKEIVIK